MTISRLTSIDPGADAGYAYFEDGTLFECTLGIGPLLGLVVIELPQVYRSGKARPQDLITLAVRVGEVKAMAQTRGCTVRLVWPHDWKGSLTKDVMSKRIIARLTDEERELFETRTYGLKTRRHNVVDAIGIGLHALGRL